MSRIHEALKKAQEERAEQSRAGVGQFPLEAGTTTVATTLEPR